MTVEGGNYIIYSDYLFLAVVLFCIALYRFGDYIELPPGPHSLQMLSPHWWFKYLPPATVLDHWANSYGPIIRFSVGPRHIICLNVFDATTEAELTALLGPFELHSIILDSQLSSSSSESMIKIKSQTPIPTNSKEYEAETQKRISKQIGPLLKELESNEDIESCLAHSVTNILYDVMWNRSPCQKDHGFIRFVAVTKELFKLKANVDPSWSSYSEWLPARTKRRRDIQTAKQEIDTFFLNQQPRNGFISNGTLNNHSNCSSSWNLENGKVGSLEHISDAQPLASLLGDSFIAQYEAIMNPLQTAIFQLARNPRKQKLVLKDIQDTLNDLKHKLDPVYLPAVVLESLRLSAKEPQFVSPEVTDNAEFWGYELPTTGTMVMLNMRKIMRDEDLFQKSDRFDPERFLGGSMEAQIRRRILRTLFFAKSKSWNPCLLETFLYMVLTALITTYSFKLKDSKRKIGPKNQHDSQSRVDLGRVICQRR